MAANEVIVLPLAGREYPIKFGIKAWTRLLKELPDLTVLDQMTAFEQIPLLIGIGANPEDNLPTGDDLTDAIDGSDPEKLARIIPAFNESFGFFQTVVYGVASAAAANDKVKPKGKK